MAGIERGWGRGLGGKEKGRGTWARHAGHRAFIRHRRSEISPFTTQNSPANMRQPMTKFSIQTWVGEGDWEERKKGEGLGQGMQATGHSLGIGDQRFLHLLHRILQLTCDSL